MAQTGGDGAIQGVVTDKTGASVPHATVTATNMGSSVKTTRVTTDAGLYNLTSLIPGTYTVVVTANGFQKFQQENVTVTALSTIGLNISLVVGSQSEEVTVSTAPPALDTANATLGGSIESKEYMSLPLLVSGNQQRDITQFSNLLPGAQLNPAGRSSIIGGTQARLGEEYLDGVPLTTISQQGDNRPIFNAVPMEAISEVQVVTSGFSAEYQGIGLENYTLKPGGNQYHGTVADFIRNTVFDTWGFAAPWATITNSQGVRDSRRMSDRSRWTTRTSSAQALAAPSSFRISSMAGISSSSKRLTTERIPGLRRVMATTRFPRRKCGVVISHSFLHRTADPGWPSTIPPRKLRALPTAPMVLAAISSDTAPDRRKGRVVIPFLQERRSTSFLQVRSLRSANIYRSSCRLHPTML